MMMNTERIMDDYEARRLQVLVNCRLLCEGWDAAWTSGCVDRAACD